MQKIDHRKRARRAYPILRRVAQAGKRITYKELTDTLGLHHRAARWLLGVIQAYCAENDLPPLQALVIRKADKVPGKGYAATPCGGRKYRKAVRRVQAFNWPKKLPL